MYDIEAETPNDSVAEWTIMIYMSGDNNLSAECVWALTEIKKGLDSDKMNVLVQFDPSCDGMSTKRFILRKSGAEEVYGYGHNGSQQGSNHSNNGFGPLAQTVFDEARHNQNTGEVHFRHESEEAHELAGERIRTRRLHDKERKTLNERQLFNLHDLDDVELMSNTDTNSASPITLYNFLSWGVQDYAAQHYAVIVAGHSAGIMNRFLLRDEGSGRYMTLRQLQRVLKFLRRDLKKSARKGGGRAGKIDIFGFDTCLMSMAEVCYELKDCPVDIIIGSETYTPASGWPYQQILQKIKECKQATNGKELTATKLAAQIVESYVEYYRDYLVAGMSATLSALEVNQIGPLRGPIDYFAEVLMREMINERDNKERRRQLTDALILAHWEAQSYNGELYVDLVDFCECLSRRYPYGDVRPAALALAKFVKESLIIKTATTGTAYQYSNGCAIYFPWCEVADFFWQLDFGRESRWGHFLELYTNLTRRDFRRPPTRLQTPEQRTEIERLDKLQRNFLFRPVFNSYRMGSDRMGSDRMGSDRMGSDRMGSDRMGSDRMGSDRMGSEVMMVDLATLTSDVIVAEGRGSDRMGSDRMGSDRMGSDRMGSDRMGSDRMGSDRMGSDRMGSDRMGSDRMGSDRMGSDRMGSDRMGSDRMGSDRMGSDRMGSDRMGSDRMGMDKSGNPIHSMRNPPIVSIDLT